MAIYSPRKQNERLWLPVSPVLLGSRYRPDEFRMASVEFGDKCGKCGASPLTWSQTRASRESQSGAGFPAPPAPVQDPEAPPLFCDEPPQPGQLLLPIQERQPHGAPPVPTRQNYATGALCITRIMTWMIPAPDRAAPRRRDGLAGIGACSIARAASRRRRRAVWCCVALNDAPAFRHS